MSSRSGGNWTEDFVLSAACGEILGGVDGAPSFGTRVPCCFDKVLKRLQLQRRVLVLEKLLFQLLWPARGGWLTGFLSGERAFPTCPLKTP